ncbi:MAG TPA: PCYCGC motif-containing (lipo)protein [Thermoanaerobaculia bacterium]|jgi:hypothetical protein
MKLKPISGVLLLSVSTAVFAAATPRLKKPPRTPEPTNSCSTCVERRPTLDPELFAKGYEPEVKPGYEAARKYPATLDRIHCFCECAENPRFHHKTLLTCFTDLHGAGCGICLSEARLAALLKDKGLSDAEVRNTVESVHRTDGHPSTN